LNNFESFGLSENLLKAVLQMGFEKPTPIQEKAIPYLLGNDKTDFIGLAQTGTGKTAAFGLPLIELVDDSNPQTQALIMAPTRELGQQTAKQLVAFSAHYKKLNVEVVYGGAAITNQIRALKRPTQIVVATPGRLLDLIRRGAIKLANVKYVVLDEADEMLNMGFKEDIDSILSNIKVEHSTWLFSATMPNEIRKIVKKYMDNPLEVSINSQDKTNTDITHQYIVTRASDKLAALRRFLDISPDMRGILFCRTKRETQQIADELAAQGYKTEALHGDLSQAQRDSAMNRFKGRNMQLLVATDVAARGIDVSDLSHVIHHKLPDQLEAYTHRSGRTGRAGNKGVSIAFISGSEGRKIKDLERKLKVSFEKIEVPSMEELKDIRMQGWVEKVVNMPISKEAESTYETLKSNFDEINKDDILKRLLSNELQQLSLTEKGDLNVGSDRGTDSNLQRFFINIGSDDGLTEKDLTEFLSEVSKTDTKHIGDISLQDKRAFFNVEKSKAKGFGDYFIGLELESGHKIKVNAESNRNEGGGGRKPRRNYQRGGFQKGGRSRGGSFQKGDRRSGGRKGRR